MARNFFDLRRSMKFTIERSRWRNSHHGKGQTKLLNKEGYQCCLGFCALQFGTPKHRILNLGSPDSVRKADKTFDLDNILVTGPNGGIFGNGNSVLSVRAIRINDNNQYDLQLKESMLESLFKEFGHEVEFVGDYEVDS